MVGYGAEPVIGPRFARLLVFGPRQRDKGVIRRLDVAVGEMKMADYAIANPPYGLIIRIRCDSRPRRIQRTVQRPLPTL
jgi:hypothetical protein